MACKAQKALTVLEDAVKRDRPCLDDGAPALSEGISANSTQPEVPQRPISSFTSTRFSIQSPMPEAAQTPICKKNDNLGMVIARPDLLPFKPHSSNTARNRQPALRHGMISRKLTAACKIYIKRGERWVLFHMDSLLAQTVLEFFQTYAQTTGAVELPMLRFEMPEVDSEGDRVREVPKGDSESFHNLKVLIQQNLIKYLQENPAPSFLAVFVTSPQVLARDTLDIRSNEPSTTPGRAARTKPRPQNCIRAASLATLGQRQDRPDSGPSSSMHLVVRVQKDARGKFSRRYNSAVLNLRTTNVEFFAWFANQTGHAAPSGPPALKFTFKDAMPTPKSSVIEWGDEKHFECMKLDIEPQCDLVAAYMPEVFEFAILVTAPGWTAESRAYR